MSIYVYALLVLGSVAHQVSALERDDPRVDGKRYKVVICDSECLSFQDIYESIGCNTKRLL